MAKKAVIVQWEDSATTSGWRDDAKEAGTAECQSVGFVLEHTSKVIKLAQSISIGGHFAEVISIPKFCIKSVRGLMLKRKSVH